MNYASAYNFSLPGRLTFIAREIFDVIKLPHASQFTTNCNAHTKP